MNWQICCCFLGEETIRSAGVRYHYVIGVVLILGLWSVVPRRSQKKPQWWG